MVSRSQRKHSMERTPPTIRTCKRKCEKKKKIDQPRCWEKKRNEKCVPSLEVQC